MILIGQYDSAYVRRVGLALAIYGLHFEHWPWSVFSDAKKLRTISPLGRVPVLVLDDRDFITDSHAILDYVDGLMPPERRLLPQEEPARRQARKVLSLATGVADKMVTLFYELNFHETPSAAYVDRMRSQIVGALDLLEKDRAAAGDRYWFGARIGHADIAVACVMRHLAESLPDMVPFAGRAALAAHCARLEALPVFQELQQPFVPPA